MVKLNRINYEGLDKRFILRQMSYILDNKNQVEEIITRNKVPMSVSFYTSKDAQEEIENANGFFFRFIAKFAFRYKEMIKRVPILGEYAIKIKESFLMRESRIKDVSYLLSLNVNQFIYGCYKEFLNREPDSYGFASYQRMICEGASKEAIIYLFFVSDEFKKDFHIKNINNYKKKYDNYRIKNIIKKIPVLSYLVSFFMLPKRIHSFIIDAKINEANKNQNEELQLVMLTQIQNSLIENGEALKALEEKYNNISTQIDGVSSLLTVLSEKYDDFTSTQKSSVEQLKQSMRRCKTVIYGAGVTVVQTDEFLLGVPSEEWRLAMYLSVYGVFEYGSEKLFKSLLEPGLVVLDIGANLGIYTLHAAKAGCKVFSYEPTPSIYHLLNENIRLNGFTESKLVTTYNLAVGEAEEAAYLTIVGGICGWNNLFSKAEEGSGVAVSVVALDHHLPQGLKVDIVKIDVEGGEPFVLKGMERIIRENPQIRIFLEYAPEHLKRAKIDPLEFLSMIRNMGLDIKIINESTGELFDKSDEALQAFPSINLFLSKRD